MDNILLIGLSILGAACIFGLIRNTLMEKVNHTFARFCHGVARCWAQGEFFTEEEVDNLVQAYSDWDIIAAATENIGVWVPEEIIRRHLTKCGLSYDYFAERLARKGL